MKDGLPPAPVSWIVVQKQAHDLVVSTYGRGLYIMEDITRLEQGRLEPNAAAAASQPRPAFREARAGSAQFSTSEGGDRPGADRDPRPGAVIRSSPAAAVPA